MITGMFNCVTMKTRVIKMMTAEINGLTLYEGMMAHFHTVSGVDFTQHAFSHEQLNESITSSHLWRALIVTLHHHHQLR